MRLLPILLLGALLLAGCNGPTHPSSSTSSPPSTTSTTVGPADFDGLAAWNFAQEVTVRILSPDAVEARPRHPGSPGHAEVAALLHQRMQVAGWTFAWQNFTGTEYLAMEKGSVQTYMDSASYCNAAERERVKTLTFSNLIARKAATPPSDLTLVLGAHWDSKRNATNDPDPANRGKPVPAANDAASGVGILLQLMRHAQGRALPYNLEIVLFDGEDGFEDCHPLAGSLSYVASLGPGDVDRMLLLDMVGDPDAVFKKESASYACDPTLVDLLWAHARERGLTQFVDAKTTVTDDHTPFVAAGIPAVDLIGLGTDSFFLPYWHTVGDDMTHLDPAFMGELGEAVWATLADDRFTQHWPAKC